MSDVVPVKMLRSSYPYQVSPLSQRPPWRAVWVEWNAFLALTAWPIIGGSLPGAATAVRSNSDWGVSPKQAVAWRGGCWDR